VLTFTFPVLRQDNTSNLARRRSVQRLRAWRRVLATALALSTAAIAACAQPAPASQQAPEIHGPQLFEQACAKCHGPDGTGGLPMAANGPKPINLRDPEWQRGRSDDAIVAAIRDGRGAMPPFDGVLTSQQITALARHVRTLARP
jgi:mono/diheme cytochrome c family protein